jgi:hypothetical protein
MALKRCEHCRYLYEGDKDVCPACKRPPGVALDEDNLEVKRTVKRPPVKPPSSKS